MSAPPYMKLYIADYHVETTDLGVVGHGAYLLLLMAMFRAGGKLPRDEQKLARLAKCSPRQWADTREGVMSHFKVSGGSIRHGRVTKEIAKYEAVVNGAETAGLASASKRTKENKGKRSTNVERTSNENPTNLELRTQKESKSLSVVSAEPPATASDLFEPVADEENGIPEKTPPRPWERDQYFERFWSGATQQMRKRAKSRAKVWPEWRVAIRQHSGADLVRAIEAYTAGDPDVARTGGPGLHIWLKDQTFENWMGPEFAALAAPPWQGPPEVWGAVVEVKGLDWTAGYLGRCAWRDVPARAVVCSSPTVIDALRREAGDVLRDLGVAVILERAA